jgi:hypothetical protein
MRIEQGGVISRADQQSATKTGVRKMERAHSQEKIQERRAISATRVVASTLAAIVSIAGVMHGCFEIPQGHFAPSSLVINAVGPEQRLWEYATLHAFTLIPNYLVTGILAIIFGVLATIWAIAFIDKKAGPLVMFLLSTLLFVVGGGFGPLLVGSFAALIATRIDQPLTWWRAHLSPQARHILVKLWPWLFIFYVLMFLSAVETTIFGQPLNQLLDANTTYVIVLNAGNFMLIFMLLSVVTAFAHDIEVAEK